MSDSNEINLGVGSQAHQVAAGSNISQTYIAQQIVNPPAPSRAWQPPKQKLNVVRTFTGRRDALNELAVLGARGVTTPRLMIAGIGGLGKTSLAAQITHDLENEFDGGILLADIPTVDVFLKLGEWAELYDSDVKEIQDLDLRADRVRDLIHQRVGNKRVLAILDGVVDENDEPKLAPLLRALSDCAVLTTTRATNLPSLYHFRAVPVQDFDAQDAVDLFQKFLSNDKRFVGNEKQIHALGEQVGWLPFALELLAKQLDKHREWTLANLQTKLAQSKLEALKWSRVNDKEKNIFASFLLSYNGLNESEKLFFQTLGAFGGIDFDIHASAMVARGHPQRSIDKEDDRVRAEQVDDERAEEMLEHLLELSMAQTGRAMGRYRLHALMREFARTLCGENLYDADLRMAAFYCGVAIENGNKLDGKEIEHALAILDSEVSNIFAGQKWARENETREARELARDFIYRGKNAAMTSYFMLRANWMEWIEWSEYGLAACRALGDERGEGAIAGNLGLAYADKGEWDRAIELYQQSLVTLERLGDAHGMAQTYNNLGVVYHSKGEWDKAIELYQQSLVTLERVGDGHGMAQTLGNLGGVYYSKGEWDKAIELYQQSLVTKERVGDVHGMAGTYGNLGLVYKAKGEWDKAIELYQKDLAISERIGDVHGMAQTYSNLGNVYADKEEYSLAIENYEKAASLFNQLGDAVNTAALWTNIGLIHFEQGNFVDAKELVEKAIKFDEQQGNIEGLMIDFEAMSLILEKQDNREGAITYSAGAFDLCKRIGHPNLDRNRKRLEQLRHERSHP